MDGSTIIGAPFEPAHPLRSLLMDQSELDELPEEGEVRRLFKIRAADSSGHRSSASILVNRMYEKRGYHSGFMPDEEASRIFTLMATENEVTIGTISIGFDSPSGLLADDLFYSELSALRAAGRRVCEFTKLAMDSVVRSKRVLASLFHVAYIWAHRIKAFDDLIIEVNPRHVRFYEKMLGFEVRSPQRLNRRVNAPAVLMRLDFTHAHREIDRYGGRPELSEQVRSLYPFFFSIPEEAGIVGRLRSSA